MFTSYRLNMLNREAASPKNKPDYIIKSLNIQNRDTIGDIGAGGGYFTLKFAMEVGKEGKVYSMDTNQKSLTFIEDQSKKEGLTNIKTILADRDGLSLPEKSFDLFFLRNVFHHLPEQVEYFKNIKHFLKKDGRIAIIDYKKKGFSFTGLLGHYTSPGVLVDKLEKAGFYPSETFEFLPDQSFIIFKMK
jgi:arsenite methyltransferase